MTIEFNKRKYRIKQDASGSKIILYKKLDSGKYAEIYSEDNERHLTQEELHRRGKAIVKIFSRQHQVWYVEEVK